MASKERGQIDLRKSALLIFLLIGLIAGIVGCSEASTPEQQNSKVQTPEPKQEVLTPVKPAMTVEQVKAQISSSVHLDGVHFQKKVTCVLCHGKIEEGQSIEPPKDKVCLDCHGGSYDKLTALIKDKPEYKAYNPHNPGHERLQCYSCHKSHESFVLTCVDCHSIKIPQRFK